MKTTVTITLDNAEGRFVSENREGHMEPVEVSGRVGVNVDKVKEVEGVKLYFKGMAFVLWSQSKSLRRSAVYSNSEVYFNQSLWLAGAKGDKIALPSGESSFPFSFALPPNLPSSCQEKYGKVTYELEAVVRRPWKANAKVGRLLKVVAPLEDIGNVAPKVMLPVLETTDRGFSCLHRGAGRLTLTLSLPSRGVVVGQPFPVTVALENDSDVDVHELLGELKKYTTCRLTLPSPRTMQTSITLSSFTLGPTPRRSSSCRTIALPRPSQTPLNLQACTVMDVDYRLCVTAVTSGLHANVRVTTPVRFAEGALGDRGTVLDNKGFQGDDGIVGVGGKT